MKRNKENEIIQRSDIKMSIRTVLSTPGFKADKLFTTTIWEVMSITQKFSSESEKAMFGFEGYI